MRGEKPVLDRLCFNVHDAPHGTRADACEIVGHVGGDVVIGPDVGQPYDVIGCGIDPEVAKRILLRIAQRTQTQMIARPSAHGYDARKRDVVRAVDGRNRCDRRDWIGGQIWRRRRGRCAGKRRAPVEAQGRTSRADDVAAA